MVDALESRVEKVVASHPWAMHIQGLMRHFRICKAACAVRWRYAIVTADHQHEHADQRHVARRHSCILSNRTVSDPKAAQTAMARRKKASTEAQHTKIAALGDDVLCKILMLLPQHLRHAI